MASRTVSARVVVEGVQQYKQAMDSLSDSNKNFGSATGTLGDQVKDLGQKIGINIPEGATKALSGIQGMSAGSVAALGAIGAAAAVAIEAVKALHEITLDQAGAADDIITNSMISGVDAQTLQQWKYAENLIDVSSQTIQSSMSRLTRSMADAKTGNAETIAAFDALGVSVENSDGSLRNAADVFMDSIDALGGVQNATERDAIAMQIFGRSAQDLNPLIVQGSDALRGLAADAEKAGYVLDESQIAKLGEVDDAYQEMQLQIDATKKQLAVAFAPVSKAALELVTKAVGSLTKAFEKMNEVSEKASRAMKNLLGIKSEMKGYGGLGSDIAGAEWKSDVNAWVSAGGTIITPDNYNDFDKATGKLTREFYYSPEWYTGDVVAYGHMSEEEIQKLLAGNAAGTDNWRGGLTWVGEAGPELVSLPRGSQIYNAQDSQQLAGGDQIININVNGIQELSEIVDWYTSRRVRGRMA